MCILTFWLSVSFLSLAHTCFRTTNAGVRVRVRYFYLIYIFIFVLPSSQVPHISPLLTPPSAQTGFIYSRPGISVPLVFFFIITPLAFHYRRSGWFFFFITPPSFLCSTSLYSVLFLAAPEILGPIFEKIKTPPR